MGPDFTRQLIGDHVAAVPGAEISDGFVEDNDDNDRWPDRGPGARGGHHGATDYDPDGVFPGNDEDNDGIPDTNRNGNALPDYVEPFLLFAVEPDVYFYGRDWNHNGIADVREDDLEPRSALPAGPARRSRLRSATPARWLVCRGGSAQGQRHL